LGNWWKTLNKLKYKFVGENIDNQRKPGLNYIILSLKIIKFREILLWLVLKPEWNDKNNLCTKNTNGQNLTKNTPKTKNEWYFHI